MLIKYQMFSFKKMHLKMSSAKWRPPCPGLNVLRESLAYVRLVMTYKWNVIWNHHASCHIQNAQSYMFKYYERDSAQKCHIF